MLLHDNHVLARRHSFTLAFPVCSSQIQAVGFPSQENQARYQQLPLYMFAAAGETPSDGGISPGLNKELSGRRNLMTYYRLAVQDRQTTKWTWKTTALTSLQAVFQLLRTYEKLPQDSIRVFTASSKEDLDEMLSHENDGLTSSSVTATQCKRQGNSGSSQDLGNTACLLTSLMRSDILLERRYARFLGG